MKQLLRYLLLATAASLLLAPSALAGQREGAFSLSPMVGYHVFEGDQNTDDSMSYGLAAGYNVTKNWTIEFDVRYTPTETDFDNGENFDVDIWTGSMNALYHFNPDGKFVPFLVAGFGGMVFDADNNISCSGDDSTDVDFMMNAGAGLKYFFTDDLALRLDARYVADLHSDSNYDQAPGSDDPDHNLIAMAGLTWQFGGPPPAPAPPLDSDMDGREHLIAIGVEACLEYASPAAVFVPTHSGATARSIARFRFPVWTIAVSSQMATCQQHQFSSGVYSVHEPEHPEQWKTYVRRRINELGIAGELVVLAEGPSTKHPEVNHRMENIDLRR